EIAFKSAQQKVLEQKLLELSHSQQSVQTLSLGLIHHHKYLGLIVSVWEQELQKAPAETYARVWILTRSSCWL
uniref:CID domain-containing protein n=1 Tax=Meleagris gallopavo TaxID=9103 RepID=A0A803Y924_MELGA